MAILEVNAYMSTYRRQSIREVLNWKVKKKKKDIHILEPNPMKQIGIPIEQ
jgi:hypothetical protein